MRNAMHTHQKNRAAITKLDAAPARRHSTITPKNKAIPLKAIKHDQVTSSPTALHNVEVERCGPSGIKELHATGTTAERLPTNAINDRHQINTTIPETEITATRCLAEIAITTCELIEEGIRAATAIYETLVSVACISVHAVKLTWTLGCLAPLVGRGLYGLGKRSWSKAFA